MLNRDFKEFAELLNARGVDDLVVGGFALTAHGQPPRRIDLLTTIDGVTFDECSARREEVELAGVRLNIIGLEDFKTNKRASGRLKDPADLESLELPTDSDRTGSGRSR